MRVELRDVYEKVVGEVTLGPEGLSFTGDAVGLPEDMAVIGPDGLKTPDDGAAYLAALPFALRSPYLHAVVVPS